MPVSDCISLADCVGKDVKYKRASRVYSGQLEVYDGIYAVHQPNTDTKSDIMISSVKHADNRVITENGELVILAGESNN
jgi:hypothetical protein